VSDPPSNQERLIVVDEHPLLDLGVIEAEFSAPLSAVDAESLATLRALNATAPLTRSDEVKQAIRKMLRHGGYKPAGRGKPASEYLIKAADPDGLMPINAAVDVCNIVSLHSGLPISVVDAGLLQGAVRVGLGGPDESYVFNRAGQEIRLAGLLCLFDERGPCANAVKDSQRTKTHEETRRTLSLIWGSAELPGRTAAGVQWYAQLLTELGATLLRCSTPASAGR
jgi:DNA/RNA-binding domain of Phe-tRNA-synthetase-like protein